MLLFESSRFFFNFSSNALNRIALWGWSVRNTGILESRSFHQNYLFRGDFKGFFNLFLKLQFIFWLLNNTRKYSLGGFHFLETIVSLNNFIKRINRVKVRIFWRVWLLLMLLCFSSNLSSKRGLNYRQYSISLHFGIFHFKRICDLDFRGNWLLWRGSLDSNFRIFYLLINWFTIKVRIWSHIFTLLGWFQNWLVMKNSIHASFWFFKRSTFEYISEVLSKLS